MHRGRVRKMRSPSRIGARALLLPLSLLGVCEALSVPPVLDAYQAALVAAPLQTKVATAGSLALIGDALAQKSDESSPGYDTARASSFVAFDCAYRGGFQHFAFPIITDNFRGEGLEQILSTLSLGCEALNAQTLAALECTAVNQLLIVPVVYYPLFFSITGAVQGLTVDESLERAREKFVALTVRNWMFWIPAQYCQFAFFPEEWQVPYTCIMGLVWNVILSALAGSAKEAPVAATAVAVAEEPAPAPLLGGLGRIVPTGLRRRGGATGDDAASKTAPTRSSRRDR